MTDDELLDQADMESEHTGRPLAEVLDDIENRDDDQEGGWGSGDHTSDCD